MSYSSICLFDMLCNIGVIKESKEMDVEVFDDCKFYRSTLGCTISDGKGCSNMCKHYTPKKD